MTSTKPDTLDTLLRGISPDTDTKDCTYLKAQLQAHFDSDRALIAQLVAALEGLFEHCAMVHKHWGEGDNSKEAEAAQTTARAALAAAEQHGKGE